MADHAAPLSVKLDALNRFWRTLYTAFGADAALLIGAGLLTLLDKVDISSTEFWIGLGLLVVKSVLTALGSYLLRLKKAPRVDPEPTLTA
jgi:high-affinity Fe2+/Pb2+ permease